MNVIFQILQGLWLSIYHSLRSYPSCLFWGATIPMAIMLIISVSYYFQVKSFYRTQPLGILPMINHHFTYKTFIVADVFTSVSLIFIIRYVKYYYRRSNLNSAQNTKDKIENYLQTYTMVVFVYILFLSLTIFSPKYSKIQFISLLIFMINIPLIHYIPRLIVRVKHTTRYLPGSTLIFLELSFALLSLPLLIYCTISNQFKGFAYSLHSYLSFFSYTLSIASFFIDALIMLSHRFIRFHLYMPRLKNRKRRLSKTV